MQILTVCNENLSQLKGFQRLDELFDSNTPCVMDSQGNWKAMVIFPDKNVHEKIFDRITKNGLTIISSPTDIMSLLFSNNWSSLIENEAITETFSSNPESVHSSIKEDDTSDWVAIVGMSCRFPNANNPQEYWDLLAGGETACTFPPDHRTKLINVDPETISNFLKCPIDQFDASFFGFSPSEAAFTDPQARLLLEVSWEAFEDAAINPEKLKGTRTGVFHGSWLQEYRDAMNAEASPGNEEFIRKYIGNSFGCSAAKLSFFYGFTGPNVSTESGCSSSMVAVDLAVQSLQKQHCPVALVAGANVLLHMDMKQKVLWSEDGKSRTFDADANGYARAEGVAVFILKRFADANRDGDRIHAIIRGSFLSQEGLSKSFGTPTVDSECAAMEGALEMARVEPWQVDYVEAHATGTAVGDPIEAQAVVKAYSTKKIKASTRVKPLYIGSGKTNIGHTESCSGLAGIFKVVLAMKNELIPAHLNLNKINPQINFDSIPGIIPVEAVPWPKDGDRPRIAGVSSFGITGTDVHVIIQEAPELEAHEQKQKGAVHSLYLLTISAKSESALDEYSKLYQDYLGSSFEKEEDIVFSANVCRPHHVFRKAILGRSKEELRSNLVEEMCSREKAGTPKICFTFPGRIGPMDLEAARILYNTSPVFSEAMDHCENLFKASAGADMLRLLMNEQVDTTDKGVAWYALILAVQYSLVKLWASWGIQPDCVMGHCIGEISAAFVSGALPFQDIFKLLKCMEYFLKVGKEQPALMLAVEADGEKVDQLIARFLSNNKNETGWLEIACRNAFDQTVVAGDTDSICQFKGVLKSHGYRCKVLTMDFCAHSRAVEPACQQSLPIFEGIVHQTLKIQYISSVFGKVMQDEELNGQYWFNVFRKCVNFTESCRTASSMGLADVYIEMGLDGALSRLTQENLTELKALPENANVCLPSLWKVKGDKCWTGLLISLGQLYALGGNVDWERYYENGEKGRRYKRVALPPYPFQRKSFWYERKLKRPQDREISQKSMATSSIHPLLGHIIETCMEDTMLFQNWIDASVEVKYVYDHSIGTQVIFPGAAFLEMILAAVKQVNKENGWILVNGFAVNSPLHLDAAISKQVQCIVDTKSRKARVYACRETQANNKSSWKLHASACYTEKANELECNKIDDFGNLKSQALKKENATEHFYLAAQNVGLNFGKDFRSIKRLFQSENGTYSLIEVGVPESEKVIIMKYVLHPILIDAMIQGFILHTKPDLKKLHVPVKIGNICVKTENFQNLSTLYVYCTSEQDNRTKVQLLNANGNILANMTNVEMVTTSVESILKAAGCQETTVKKEGGSILEKVTLDKFYVAWQRSQFHQSGASIKLEASQQLEINKLFSNNHDFLEKMNTFSEDEHRLDRNMNKLCCLYIIKALYEMGWCPNQSIDSLIGNPEKWGIVPGLVPAFKHFVSYIDNKAIEDVGGEYERLLDKINETLKDLNDYAALKTVQACGSQLAGILQGAVSPHGILFGRLVEDFDGTLAEHYYKTTRFGRFQESMREMFTIVYDKVHETNASPTNTVRILEVGGGTGKFATAVVNFFKGKGAKYEYMFTDISPSFVAAAKGKLTGEPFIFKTLDIDMDPLKQGLSPDYFDIVVCVDVLHATKNVKRSLENLHLVTKSGGWVILKETDKPVLEVDICFGILEGYWLYEDGIRKDHCTLNGDQWLELLGNAGFRQGQGKLLSCSNQMAVITARKDAKISNAMETVGSWLVFTHGNILLMEGFAKEMERLGRQVMVVDLTMVANLEDTINRILSNNQNVIEGIVYFYLENYNPGFGPESQMILEPLLHLGKYLAKKKVKLLPRFHLVTEGSLGSLVVEADVQNIGNPNAAQAWGFMRNLRIELPGILAKSIDLEKNTQVEQICQQLMTEFWLEDKETEVAYRYGARYVRRVFQQEIISEERDVGIPEQSRFYELVLPRSKVVCDVKFEKMVEPGKLAPDEILVEVKSVSLNFKDVLAVMKPSADFENLTSIGLDFSGVIAEVGKQVTRWNVGQAVFGCGWEKGAMKSHVTTKEFAVVAMPKWMSFNEAATLPAVWITAWYCMVEVAKLQKGQTVLVHACSGGVGLIAIQIAKVLGVHVIGTAGSEKKRGFVRNLGVEHVYNSRTSDFAKEIESVTDGKGVDMVLNCLTGPGFKEASLKVCKDGGHFVEISKLDIWRREQVQERRPMVNYTVVDATQVDKEVVEGIMRKLTEMLVSKRIKPLPYTQFPAGKIKEALAYLQKAKQIGKVIVTMPKYQAGFGSYQSDTIFNDRSSYMITGGKGAIGMTVAKWMVTKGAKYLVLVGRSPASQEVEQAIADMERDYGAVVICREMDIANFQQCKELIGEFDSENCDIPPLRGIQHCAGVLSDKLLSQHENWPGYEVALSPKVQGTWNLHQLTKELPLEFFVLFSSAASPFGNIGQSNYVAANSFLDAFAEMRVAMGLPCLSIQWGQWNMGFAKDLSIDWLHPFTADEGVASLENIMLSRSSQPVAVTSGLFDLHGLLRMTPYFRDTFFETLCLEKGSFLGRDAKKRRASAKSARDKTKVLFIEQYQKAGNEVERNQLVKEFIIKVLCETLGTKPDEIQDHNQHFSEMGMDSLMSIEFANKLNAELEEGSGNGGMLDLEECGTVNKMTEVISDSLRKQFN